MEKRLLSYEYIFLIRAISCNSISIITIEITITIVPTHLSKLTLNPNQWEAQSKPGHSINHTQIDCVCRGIETAYCG